MKNTKLQILTGKTNVLVLDGTDTSVIYRHAEIDNKNSYKMPLGELYDIFLKEHSDIFKNDTTNCFSLILKNGKEIPLCLYKKQHKPIMIKISNEKLAENGNDIYIDINNDNFHMSDNPYKWQKDKILITNQKVDFKNDFSGWSNTQKLLNLRHGPGYFISLPAVEYCSKCKIKIKAKSENIIYAGYLPAIGQLQIIYQYIDLINYVLKVLNKNQLIMEIDIWSSTEDNAGSAWFLTRGQLGNYYFGNKELTVLPLFKKIN